MKKYVSAFMALSFCLLAISNAQVHGETNVEYLNTQGSTLPFSEAVRVGNILYLSGELGIDKQTGKLVPGGIKVEAQQTLENIKATLEKYGSSLDQVIKCTVMIADIKEWKDFNEVYVTYFNPEQMPARSAFGGNDLAFGARVEIECIAIISD